MSLGCHPFAISTAWWTNWETERKVNGIRHRLRQFPIWRRVSDSLSSQLALKIDFNCDSSARPYSLPAGLETSPLPIKLGPLLDSITDIYSSLAKAIECVSMALGPAIIMGMLSSLLHLVATAYFLLVELVTKGFNPFTLVQIAWIIIHTTRLILLVEPCHLAYYETHLTSDIISDAIRRPASPEIKERVSYWWTSKDFVGNCSFLPLTAGNVLAATSGPANIFQRLRNVQNR